MQTQQQKLPTERRLDV